MSCPTGWTPTQLYKERGAYFATVTRGLRGEWRWACYLTEAKRFQLGHCARGRSKTCEVACQRADENMIALGVEVLALEEEPINAKLRLHALKQIVKLRATAPPEEQKELDVQRERFLKKRVKK